MSRIKCVLSVEINKITELYSIIIPYLKKNDHKNAIKTSVHLENFIRRVKPYATLTPAWF